MCLFDFSEQSYLALQSCISLVNSSNDMEILLYHVCEENALQERIEKLRNVINQYSKRDKINFHIDTGEFFEAFEKYVQFSPPDFLVFCTHGAQGIRQLFFGANSVRVCEVCPSPALILSKKPLNPQSERIVWNFNYQGFSESLFQLFTRFIIKSYPATIFIHEVDGGNILNNQFLPITESQFIEKGFQLKKIKEEKSEPTLGIAPDILKFAESRDADLLVVGIKKSQHPMARSDAERIINNKTGIPVIFY